MSVPAERVDAQRQQLQGSAGSLCLRLTTCPRTATVTLRSRRQHARQALSGPMDRRGFAEPIRRHGAGHPVKAEFDVLVCPATSLVWSVLFSSVGVLVTDSGGVLL